MKLGVIAVAGFACAMTACIASKAGAQVYYAPYPEYAAPPEAIYPFGVPYDDTQSASLSFQIQPYAPPGAAVRVVPRCTYPNGWNVTDFSRDVNGIPSGIDHVCPQAAPVRRARSRY